MCSKRRQTLTGDALSVCLSIFFFFLNCCRIVYTACGWDSTCGLGYLVTKLKRECSVKLLKQTKVRRVWWPMIENITKLKRRRRRIGSIAEIKYVPEWCSWGGERSEPEFTVYVESAGISPSGFVPSISRGVMTGFEGRKPRTSLAKTTPTLGPLFRI